MKCREAFYLSQFEWPTCKRCIGSSSQVVYTFKFLLSAEGSFPRNLKILAKAALTQSCKDVLRHF